MMRLRQAKARCRSRKRRIQARACRWLHQAVINFVNRWRTGKQRFEQLTARQQALRASLRQLAQAYARILRELDGALQAMSQGKPQVGGELAEGLEKLGVKDL